MLAFLLPLLLAGCTRILISPGGDLRRCPPRGGDDCIAAATSAGYIEQDQVGGIGVSVADIPEPGRGLRILKVADGSPAAAAGIAAGDFLVRVKGEEVRGKREARMLMFGRQGTKVEMTLRKGGRLVAVTIVRGSLERMKKGVE